MKYVIGSGWWAPAEVEQFERRKAFGDDSIRGAAFHRLWYESICRFTDPAKIFIADSDSPVKPALNPKDDRLEIASLDRNYKHSMESDTKLCGWTRSVLLGLGYAMSCDADYFVYVEQDCLLYGEGIVEYAIERMRHRYMFGAGAGTPQPLQQSFFIVERSGFLRMLQCLDRIPEPDRVLSPEEKFARVEWDWLPSGLSVGKFGKAWRRRTAGLWYDTLPVPGGRARPIEWEAPYFYFQHASREEIETYMDRIGFQADLV